MFWTLLGSTYNLKQTWPWMHFCLLAMQMVSWFMNKTQDTSTITYASCAGETKFWVPPAMFTSSWSHHQRNTKLCLFSDIYLESKFWIVWVSNDPAHEYFCFNCALIERSFFRQTLKVHSDLFLFRTMQYHANNMPHSWQHTAINPWVVQWSRVSSSTKCHSGEESCFWQYCQSNFSESTEYNWGYT